MPCTCLLFASLGLVSCLGLALFITTAGRLMTAIVVGGLLIRQPEGRGKLALGER